MTVAHPAKWSPAILTAIAAELDARLPEPTLVLDPFAGVGAQRLADAIGMPVLGIELEPEWAGQGGAVVGNALALPVRPGSIGALVTSPTYANRMADAHEARDLCKACYGSGCTALDCLGAHPDDGQEHRLCSKCRGSGLSKRNTYRHTLGRKPSDGSAAVLRWGPKYRRLHEAVWRAANDALRPGALALVNVKNHVETYDDGEIEHPVTEWHLNFWLSLDAKLLAVVEIDTPGQRNGANRDARADCERLLVLRTRSVSWRR